MEPNVSKLDENKVSYINLKSKRQYLNHILDF